MKTIALPDNYKDYIYDDSNLKKIFRDVISDYSGNIKLELDEETYVSDIERIIRHLHEEYDRKLQSIRISVVVKQKEIESTNEESLISEPVEEIKIEEKRTNRRK